MWQRRQREALRRACADLVQDAGAFLEGGLVEALEARKEAVPAWAWTNLLAHGSIERLRWASLEQRLGSDQNREWREGRSHLAHLVLQAAGPFGPMVMFQQDGALIPLELMLAAHPEPGRSSPGDWVAQVEAALKLYRDTQRAMYPDPNRLNGEWS